MIALSRGGFYGPESGMNAFEHQESHLKAVFTFLGVTDITFVLAEGLNIGADQKAAALQKGGGHDRSVRRLIPLAQLKKPARSPSGRAGCFYRRLDGCHRLLPPYRG